MPKENVININAVSQEDKAKLGIRPCAWCGEDVEEIEGEIVSDDEVVHNDPSDNDCLTEYNNSRGIV